MAKGKIYFKNLRGEMARENVSVAKIAEVLGITVETTYRKLKDESNITLKDALKVQRKFFPDSTVRYLFNELFEEIDN